MSITPTSLLSKFNAHTTIYDIETGINIGPLSSECITKITDIASSTDVIEIKFNRTLGNYIKNLPLHHSQQILVDNEDEIRIRLKVIINEELINELIAYGDGAQVIKPKILKNKIIKRAQLILENHKE